jgi:hypothetical protein
MKLSELVVAILDRDIKISQQEMVNVVDLIVSQCELRTLSKIKKIVDSEMEYEKAHV